MIYEFRKPDGTIIEARFPMKSCPDIGQVVDIDGVPCMRILSKNPTAFNAEQVASVVHGYDREDISLPKGDLGHGVGPHGNPIIKDRRHERNVMAEHGLRRD